MLASAVATAVIAAVVGGVWLVRRQTPAGHVPAASLLLAASPSPLTSPSPPAATGPGDAWGCVGRWFAGRWHTAPANQYAAAVQSYESQRIWQTPSFQEP